MNNNDTVKVTLEWPDDVDPRKHPYVLSDDDNTTPIEAYRQLLLQRCVAAELKKRAEYEAGMVESYRYALATVVARQHELEKTIETEVAKFTTLT